MSLMALQYFLFVLLLCAIFPTAKAQSPQLNISLGSILFTNSSPKFWPSESGNFAFGFYPSNNGNGFKIGIWIVGSPKNTIVWTLWRNDPVIAPGAALLFSSEGELLFRSSLGYDRVVAQTTQRASVASMHDTGNFVLYDPSMNLIWASFAYPSDTLLVTQQLVPESFLYSSASEMDHSTGDFKLRMLQNGILNAYPMKSTYEGKYLYWSSGGTSSGGNVSLTLAKDGRLYLQNSSGFNTKNLSEGGNIVNNIYLYRATLDVDCILRIYQHQMGAKGSFNVSIVWSMIKEDNRCSVFGICGINSYCTMNGSNVTCICLPGFDFLDPKQPRKGCILNNTLGDCSLDNVSDMSVLGNIQWERNEYDVLTPTNEQACSRACLEDCNCVVATYGSQICYKQKLPLRFGKIISTDPTKTLVKMRKGISLGDPTINDNVHPNKIAKKKQPGKEILIGGMVLITFSLIVFLTSGHLIYRYQLCGLKIISRHANPSEVLLKEEIILRSFTYDQIVKATEDFKEEIGRGASGRVFKGVFADYGGKEVAVKKLEKLEEDGECEFRNEMKIIGRTHHKNLVRLIGFCSEGSNRLLVYELMKNGSLGDLLFKAKKWPSWKERVRILVEIAKGLHYLHEECETRIIHCDIKPYNVLMDESWCVKIADFGLSKLLKPEQTRTNTIPRGTRGYAAPEWYNNTPITVKADVYSFGILLLEIICCRKNTDVTAPDEEVILLDWVYECYEARELRKVVGDQEEDEVDMEEFEKIVKVGLLCVQTELTLRPAMKSVILMLEGTVVTPLPPSTHAHSSMC